MVKDAIDNFDAVIVFSMPIRNLRFQRSLHHGEAKLNF